MLTKLKIYNLAYAELSRKWDIERQRPDSIIKQHLLARYDAEIEELHTLILMEEDRGKGGMKNHHVDAN